MVAPNTDHDRSDAQHENAKDEFAVTPLPWRQLLIVYIIQFAEPITATVIYPFINPFVRLTGVTGGDETKTGYFAGLIESIFFLSEALTVVFWGMASDRFGRRSTLIFGPLGLSVTMLGFGASRQFWCLVLFRCFQGIFNGNIGVSKTVMGEITDKTNIGDAFAYIPVMWSVGTTLAPIIGGVFSNPAVRWPDTLGKLAYFRDHPYFLPCFVASMVAFLGFLGALVGLKETLPSARLRQKQQEERKSRSRLTSSTSLLEDNDVPVYSSIEGTAHQRGDSLTALGNSSEAPQPVSFKALLMPQVLIAVTNHGLSAFCDMSVQVLMPLMWSTSVENGGLGFTPYTIGITLGIYGVLNVCVQTIFLGKIIRRFGPRKVYLFSISAFLVSLPCFLLERHFARLTGVSDWRVWTVIIVHLIVDCTKFGAYVAVQIFITDSAPSQSALGSVNGLAQAVACISRSLAPSAASSLFAISLQRNWLGGDAVFYVLIGIVVCCIRSGLMLPKKLSLK